MAVSDDHPGLPLFITVVCMDDQPIIHYDSQTRRTRPVAAWIRKVEQDEPQFWDEESEALKMMEDHFTKNLKMLVNHLYHNSSTDTHTLQHIIRCKMGPDGQPRVESSKYGLDGENLLDFNSETLSWTVVRPEAELLKQKLESLQTLKNHLDKRCTVLQRFLVYGNETLQRTESPEHRVTRKMCDSGQETLFCQLYGFYPKNISVTWMKDGKGEKPDNFMEDMILPNSDGTYYTWRGITIDPKDRDRYLCRVEHKSLPEPLELAWKEPASNWRHFLAIPGFVVLVILLVAIIYFLKKRRATRLQLRNNIRVSRETMGSNIPTPGETDNMSYHSAYGDSGRVSRCSEDEGSDRESGSYDDGDSGHVSLRTEDSRKEQPSILLQRL